MCVRNREWKIQNEREMVMTIKCAQSGDGVENDAGVKESRVSRVTIRFGTAVVSAGSWALSICNSLYGVRDVCTWLYCNGHGNATRTISNYMAVDGKRSARDGRIARIVETLTYFVFSPPLSSHPSDVPFCKGALKIQASRPAVIRWRMIFRGSRRMEFSSNIMSHKPTGSIFRLFIHRTTIRSPTSRNVYLRKGCLRSNRIFPLNHRYDAEREFLVLPKFLKV
jgi:hypothetical protein